MSSMSVFVLSAIAALTAASSPSVQRFRIEYLPEEQANAIESDQPRFSWGMAHPQRGQKQTAYEINILDIHASTVVWSSGKVASADSLNVKSGSQLKPDTEYNATI